MRNYDDEVLLFFPDVEKNRPVNSKKTTPAVFEKSIEDIREEDVAPDRLYLRHHRIPQGIAAHPQKTCCPWALNLNQVDTKYESDEFVSFLPLPWIGEQMMSVASSLAIGFTINFPEETGNRHGRYL